MAPDSQSKKYGIWAWVGAIYGPIVFWFLFVTSYVKKIKWIRCVSFVHNYSSYLTVVPKGASKFLS